LRGKVVWSKLIFAIGLTAFAVVRLSVTPLEMRIQTLERQVAQGDSDDPAIQEMAQRLEAAKARRVAVQSDFIERHMPFTLGLDLQGGTEVRLGLSLDPARYNRLANELRLLEEQLAAAAPAERERLTTTIGEKRQEIADESATLDKDLASAVDVVRRRLNSSGLAEIPVTRQGRDKVLIQLPGMDASQADQTIATIQREGKLEFRIVVDEKSPDVGLHLATVRGRFPDEVRNLDLTTMEAVSPEFVDDHGRHVVTGAELYDWLRSASDYSRNESRRAGEMLLVSKAVLLRGDAIVQASAEPDPASAGFQVSLTLNALGARIFEHVTQNHLGERLAIVLDGQLRSAPTLQTVISDGHARITGSFTQNEAKQLDTVLKSGSMKVKIDKEFQSTVGATLGEDSIRNGFWAMVFGLLLVVLFMMIYYRKAGVVTTVVLVLNTILVAAALASMNATMTLPGFAGFVLTIGMAVDANVLIFERIREERERGNPLQRAMHLGYARAFVTILDSNLTTLFTAVILHHFGTETVRGFAMTLMIGLVISMFCSVVITRWLFEALIAWGKLTEFRMMRVFHNLNVDWVKYRRLAMGFSAALIVLGLALIGWRGDRNLGQDFTGGVLANIVTRAPLTSGEPSIVSPSLPTASTRSKTTV
jgi:SecD/SecF fusion protein